MKFFLKSSLMGMILSAFLAGCGSAPPPAALVSAGPGESEIVVYREDRYAYSMLFYVNGELKETLGGGQRKTIIVPNGTHVMIGVNSNNTNLVSEEISIDADSNRITFKADWGKGYKPLLTQESQTALAAPAAIGKKGIDGAIERAAQALIASIPQGSTVAFIGVSADTPSEGDYVTEETTVALVNAKKYTIVDRKSLDAIRSEQKFQMTGEVDDDSAVSIGKFVGADVVITGAISGTGDSKRLRLKALNVKTAAILAMASEKI